MGSLSIIVALIVTGMFLYFYVHSRSVSMQATTQTLSPQQYQQQFAQEKHLLLDVRQPEEFKAGHIPGAQNISLQTLEQRLAEVPKSQPVVLICRSGNRTKAAAQILAQAGYTQVYDLGGMIQWQAAGLPVR
jgi:rhodanese-related sulfurtransferase